MESIELMCSEVHSNQLNRQSGRPLPNFLLVIIKWGGMAVIHEVSQVSDIVHETKTRVIVVLDPIASCKI
jgi:hypothetical protein